MKNKTKLDEKNPKSTVKVKKNIPQSRSQQSTQSQKSKAKLLTCKIKQYITLEVNAKGKNVKMNVRKYS